MAINAFTSAPHRASTLIAIFKRMYIGGAARFPQRSTDESTTVVRRDLQIFI